MKIAIASDDGKQIARHFGRTKGFALIEIDDHKVVHKAYIENTFTGHARGHHNENHGQHEHHHSHGGVLQALNECSVVISNGMGHRMMIDLEAAGKQVFITNTRLVDEALNLYLANKLEHHPGKSCQH